MTTVPTYLPRYTEIETSRYCNRLCEWCPNSVFLDRQIQELMNWSLFEHIIESLSKYRYSGWLAFHNYNEPLANPRLLDELRYAKSKLPKARLSIFTNGDKLTDSILVKLEEASVEYIRVTVYPKANNQKVSSYATLWKWLKRRPDMAQRIWEETKPHQGLALESSALTKIQIISPVVAGYYDRGGTIISLRGKYRLKPCNSTRHSLSIDYLGNVKMCCNVVTGNKDHKPYILGNLTSVDPIDLWNSESFENLRQKHAQSDWELSPICKNCAQNIAPVSPKFNSVL